MSRLRSLESLGDFCSLPSPHRILRGVAGMAFNFSQVEVEPTVESQGAAAAVETTRSAANPLRNAALSARFGIPHYSPAS
jgi:hypothetical protein